MTSTGVRVAVVVDALDGIVGGVQVALQRPEALVAANRFQGMEVHTVVAEMRQAGMAQLMQRPPPAGRRLEQLWARR
ncbi:MAG: hypothetical protein M3O70_10795 [Actinomycetota bacterium]|nr:hypothetical protein [Actinomycetota bacterium]